MISSIFILSAIGLATYCLGSLCSAILIARFFQLPDPRSEGSKNPGTTNILRIAGKKYAALVLLSDLMKGLLPVLLLKYSGFAPNSIGYIGLLAVIGHIYPVFFNFKGGKGVATSLGVLFGLNGWLGLAVVLTWIFVACISRYSSLAGMLALSLSPIYLWFLTPNIHLLIPLMMIVVLILYQHSENILRLWQGRESKLKL